MGGLFSPTHQGADDSNSSNGHSSTPLSFVYHTHVLSVKIYV